MEALLLLDGVYVEDRYRTLEEASHAAAHGRNCISAAVHLDAEDEGPPAGVERSHAEQEKLEHHAIMARAQELHARWPMSQLHKKLAVLEAVLEGLYQHDREDPTTTSAPSQSPGRPNGLVRGLGRLSVGEAISPVPVKELPLPTQIVLRMFFRTCQSLQDPAKIVANARLSVQVAAKLPAILSSMPACILSPGLMDDPAVAGTQENASVSSVFQQLLGLFTALLGLPGSSACDSNPLPSAAAAQTTSVCLTANERATVVTAYVALSLKWGRLRHLLTGVSLLLESGCELPATHFELLAPLFEDLATATAELPQSTLDNEKESFGYLMSFGKGDHGKLGHGQCSHVTCQEGNCTENKAVPTMIATVRDVPFRKIDSLSTHSIAVTATGELMAWGNGDKYRLGHGSTTKEYTPRTIEYLRVKGRVRDLACGLGHTLALMESGELYAWGNGSNGRLGIGDTSDRSSPTKVPLPADTTMGDLQDGKEMSSSTATGSLRLRHIFCGASHSLAVSWDGRAFSWGKNNQGQCGHGNTNDQWTILEIESFHDDEEIEEEECIVHAAGGWEHTLFCTTSGRVYACGCGYKDSRRAGIPPVLGHGDCDRRLKPSVVQAFVENHEEIIKVACGWDHSLAVSSSGKVYTWGSGTNGKLGHGDEESCDVPMLVHAMEGKRVKDAKAGCEHTVLLTHDHELWTFGQGDSGRLGHGDNQTRKRPTRVEYFAENGLKPVAIAVGDKYNLVLVDDGENQWEHSGVEEREYNPYGTNERWIGQGQRQGVERKISTNTSNEVFGASWLLSIAACTPVDPVHGSSNKGRENRAKFDVKATESFVPSGAGEVVLFIMGHIDRIASGYLAGQGDYPIWRSKPGGSPTQSTSQPALFPFAVDTSHDAMRALLELLERQCPSSSALGDKAKTGGSSGLTLAPDQRMGITLACLRILQLNLSRSLDCNFASSTQEHATELLDGEGSPNPKHSDLFDVIHRLLDNLAELDGRVIASKFQDPTTQENKCETDLPSLGSAISQEAARALKVGFMQFYPTGSVRWRLLRDIVLGNADTSFPSMRTVILSGQLCEDTAMEEIFTHLYTKELPERPGETSHDHNNEGIDCCDSHPLNGLMLSLLKRSSAKASDHLGDESFTDYSQPPDCFLRLLHVLQTHSFSLVNKFITSGGHSSDHRVKTSGVQVFSTEIFWRLLEELEVYVDALLSEALVILKKLHKASCQHEEVITWRLNGSFFHVLLPNAVECLTILFQHRSEETPSDIYSDDRTSAEVQLNLVECVLPKLHPMLKMLDEVSWKMQSTPERDNQHKDDNLECARQQPGTLYCEPQRRNWFVELGDACAILCGKLSCHLLYRTKLSNCAAHRKEPLSGISERILREGYLLPEDFDLWASGGDSLLATKPISTILEWEHVGVFEVEDEILGGDGTDGRLNSSSSSLSTSHELTEDQDYLIQFIGERSEDVLQTFILWIIAKVSPSEECVVTWEQCVVTLESQHLVRILSAVIVWHLGLTAELRECCRIYDKEGKKSMPNDSDRSDNKVPDKLGGVFGTVLDTISGIPPTDNGTIGARRCTNAVPNARFLLNLYPTAKLVEVSPQNEDVPQSANLSSNVSHDSVSALYEFITCEVPLNDLRFSLAQKCVDAMLLRTGICVLHDLLRKLTTSSAKSCLLAEFAAVVFTRYVGSHGGPMDWLSSATLPKVATRIECGTKSLGKAIENLYVRVAKIASSEESSFDLKMKALLVWAIPLAATGLGITASVGLIAKAGIVSSLADLLLEEVTILDTHTAMNPFGLIRDRDRWYSLPSVRTAKKEARVPARLKAVRELLFAQTPAQTVSLLAWETFCAVTLQLKRSTAFELQKRSLLLCAGGSVANLHATSSKELLTPRATAVSPRKRLTLPKKTVIATIEQSIEQMGDALFLMLQRVSTDLESTRQSAVELAALLASPVDITTSEKGIPGQQGDARVFLLGRPMQVSESSRHLLQITKMTPVKNSCVHTNEMGLSVSLWLYVDQTGVMPTSSQSEAVSGVNISPMESSRSASHVCILAFGGGRDSDSNLKTAAGVNDLDRFDLILQTGYVTISHISLQLSLKVRDDGNITWRSVLIEEKVPSRHWTQLTFTFTIKDVEQLQVFIDGKRSSWHSNQRPGTHGALLNPDFLQTASSWTQMATGGPLDADLILHTDLGSVSNPPPVVLHKTLPKHGNLGFAAIVDDVWIMRETLPEETVTCLQRHGTLLFQLKHQNVIEDHCLNLLRLLCQLSDSGRSSHPKAELPLLPLSDRWVMLCVHMLLHSCRGKELAQVYLCNLLRQSLPAISPSPGLDVRAIGNVLFGNAIGGISETIEWTRQHSVEDMISAFYQQSSVDRQDDATAMARKQHESIYNVMKAIGMLSKNLVDQSGSNPSHLPGEGAYKRTRVVAKEVSLRFAAGVHLFQKLYCTPSWKVALGKLTASASTIFQSPTELENVLETAGCKDSRLEDLVILASIIGGYAEGVISDIRASQKGNTKVCSTANVAAYAAPLFSVVEIDNANSVEANHIQTLVLSILREDVQQTMRFSPRKDLLIKCNNDITAVEAADLKTAGLVHLCTRVLRFFMVQLLREQQSSADMPWHQFLERHPRMCDDLLRMASSSTASFVITTLGPDADKALKLRRIRLLTGEVLRSFPTIQDLEKLQWHLWEEMIECPTYDPEKLWWQQDSCSHSKVALEVVGGGGAEVNGLTVKALEHFPTVRLANAHFCANTGLWFYEVVLLTDGLMQVGYVDGDFAANAVQGQGVGDHANSWAFDGFRCKKWNVNSYDYGDSWHVDDVVGVLLDTDRMEMSYFLNGKFLGVAFSALPMMTSSQMCPAASLNVQQCARFNFGEPSAGESSLEAHPMSSFRYPPSLASSGDQNRLRPVIAAIKRQTEVGSGTTVRSIASNLSARSCGITTDVSSESESDDGNIGVSEPDEIAVSGGALLGQNTGDSSGPHSNDRDDGFDDHRRRELIEGLTALGFPLEWATRCAAETRMSMDEAGAVSWILEQMEKVALDVHSRTASSSPFDDDGMQESNDDTASHWSMSMALPDHLIASSAEGLGTNFAAVASSNLPSTSQQVYNHDVKLASTSCDDKSIKESEAQDADALDQLRQSSSSVITNPFLTEEKEYRQHEEETEGLFPVVVRDYAEVNSLMAKLILPEYSNLQNETTSDSTRGDGKSAAHDRLPLCLSIDSSILVAYARQCLLSFLTRGVQDGNHQGVYEPLTGWLLQQDTANRFLQFLRMALALDRRDEIAAIGLWSVERTASGSPIRLRKALLALLQYELRQSTTSVDEKNDSEKATANLFPLFSFLCEFMKTQCERALARMALPQSKKRTGKRTPSGMKMEASFLIWVAGVVFTHIEAQRRSDSALAESNVASMRMFSKLVAASCYSISFFEKLVTMASRASGAFMSWKYVAIKMITRILGALRIYDTKICQEVPGANDINLVQGRVEDFTWFSGTQLSFFGAAQLGNVAELFALRCHREFSSRGFFSDFTCALFALLVQASEPLDRVSRVHSTPPLETSNVFLVNGYSSTQATISWSQPLVAKTTLQTDGDALVSVNSEDDTNAVQDADPMILSLQIKRVGPTFPGTTCANPAATVPARVLPSKGTYTVRNLLADTQYSFQLVPVHTLESHSITNSLHEDSDPANLLEPKTTGTARSNASFAELLLQTSPEPLFELDSDAMGKNLVLLKQNLSVTNTVNKKWHSVRASVAFDEGVHQWHVRLDTCVSKNIFIGVCTAQASMENYIGSDAYGYGFLANKAVWHNKSKMYSYGEIFKQGDIIQVTLDCDAKTLSFSRNGQYLGIAATNLHVGSSRNNANLVAGGAGTDSGCKWYPAFSMYNKDDRLTLIPPSAASILSRQQGRMQNVSVFERIEDMQDILAYQSHIVDGKPPTGTLFEKAFEEFAKWSRGELVFREGPHGQIINIDTSKAATEKFGLAANDSVFTPKGQCLVLGEHGHELWYEVDDGSSSALYGAMSVETELGSWSLSACREMLASPDEFPVHHHRKYQLELAAPLTIEASGDVVPGQQEDTSVNRATTAEPSLQSFVDSQRRWCDGSRGILLDDSQLMVQVASIAASRALSSPLCLSFTDISTAFLLEKIPLKCGAIDAGSDKSSYEQAARHAIARIGLLLYVNRCLCNVVRLVLPSNVFATSLPCFRPEGSRQKPQEDGTTGKQVSGQETNANDEVASIAALLSSPHWGFDDPSAFNSIEELAVCLLFRSQKEQLVGNDLQKSSTVTNVSTGTRELSKSGNSNESNDLLAIKVIYPPTTIAPFWELDSKHSGSQNLQAGLNASAEVSVFAQLAHHLSAHDAREWRRKVSQPFEAIPISQAFRVTVEKAPILGGNTEISSVTGQDDQQQDDDEDGDQQLQHPSSKQTAQYLQLFETAVREIQSPAFPLFAPAEERKTAGSPVGMASAPLQLDINTGFLATSSFANAHASQSKVLLWYFSFGQVLGIAWRGKIVLPLQFLTASFWEELVSPTTPIRNEDNGNALLSEDEASARRTAIHAVRNGLYSIIPSRCVALSTGVAHELRARLSDLDVCYVTNLRRHATYSSSLGLQPHHNLFWDVVEAFTSVERRLLQQFINPDRRDSPYQVEASEDREEEHAFVLEIAEALADGRDNPDACYPVVVPTSGHSSRLHLPAYSSARALRHKLLLALTNVPFM